MIGTVVVLGPLMMKNGVQNMIHDGNRMKNENDGQDAHHDK